MSKRSRSFTVLVALLMLALTMATSAKAVRLTTQYRFSYTESIDA